MRNTLPIIPFSNPLSGILELPGSKSITNRALVLAALSSNSTEIHNASLCQDSLIMVEALKSLGFSIKINTDYSIISIQGLGGHIPNGQAHINVGDAGTVARFLPALLSLHPNGLFHLDGSPSMRNRPIKPLLDALEAIGAASFFYHKTKGAFPFTMKTHGMQSGSLTLDNSLTNQVLSALLMIAPFTPSTLKIHFASKAMSWPFVEMTLQMMQRFSPNPIPFEQNNTFHFTNTGPYSFPYKSYYVEPDASAASYFLALLLIHGGTINIPHLSLQNSIQGDHAFSKILQDHGLIFNELSNELEIRRIYNSNTKNISHNFSAFSDTFLTLAAIAPLLQGPTHISGLYHTRFQECDRLSAMAQELQKLNQKVIEKKDSITIFPQPLRPTTIQTYNDHRIAMSFAILGSYDLLKTGLPWLSIDNPSCCAKTFPTFFNKLNQLRIINTKHSCIKKIS